MCTRHTVLRAKSSFTRCCISECVLSPQLHTVTLINPPSASGTLANREGAAGMGTLYEGQKAFLYPPQTLATVAATLRAGGHAVRVLDALVEDLPPDVTQADVVGVFVSFASLEADLDFLAGLRPKTAARLVAFGPAMRFVSARVLAGASVDAVLVGEAEGFFRAVLAQWEHQTEAGGPRVWTPLDVQASGCDAEGFVQDLDSLPFPAWDLLPYARYELLTVLSSRGCPARCSYCPYAAAQGHRFRARSTENVLAELTWLSERFQPARIVFRDPVFAYDRKRVVALCEGILQRDLRLRWECESRPEHFDANLLRLMQRAGCTWVKIGLETTDAPLLQRLRRVESSDEAARYIQQVSDVAACCAEIGLHCRVFVMAGLPGQDVDMARRTATALTQIRPTALNVKQFDAYPGLDVTVVDEGDLCVQMDVLRQAQVAIVAVQPMPGWLVRSKRWLRGTLRRNRRV